MTDPAAVLTPRGSGSMDGPARYHDADHGSDLSDPGSSRSQAKPERQLPKLSLAHVVGFVTAVVVIIVATITFSITYAASLRNIEAVGVDYASALIATARVQTEVLFDGPTEAALSLRRTIEIGGFYFPREEVGSNFSNLGRIRDIMVNTVLQLGPRIPIFTLTFSDGSEVATRFHNSSILVVYMLNARPFRLVNLTTYTIDQRDPCGCGITDVVDYHWPSMVPTAEPVSNRTAAAFDPRTDSFGAAGILAFLQQPGTWATPSYFDSTGEPFFFIPAVISVYNATMPVGVMSITVSVDEAAKFLRDAKLTPNAHMFILDTIATAIAATTHPAPFVTLTPTTNRFLTGGAHCANSMLTAAPEQTEFTLACRARARDFPYPPLQAASRVPALMRPATSEVLFNGTLEADGEQYYAAAAKVSNGLRSFALSLLLLMPQKDVLGDIVRSRNIVIGIVVAVLLVAVATSSLVIALVMRPLRQVASKMRQTARLNETVDDGETSRLSEVAALQNSYRRMDVAIKNFTKYVPRDVVKDLMKTNQLCLIEMEPKACTMLFVDIAGFTSMCERVPPDALSGLVSKYFEIMSSLVMGHSGLIDKFIGDCIMAVWGAPFDVPSKAARATLCGLRMDRETRVDPLLSAFDAEGEQLSIRVGVASGEVLAGNMGSAERMNYTVIGDAVNLASRIEALNKQFGTRVSICNATAQELKSLFVLRALANVAVVGKKAGVLVHEVVGISADIAASDLIQFRAEHDRAYADITDTDESMSHVSFRTVDSGAVAAGNARGGQVANVVQLLDQARVLRNCPLVATPAQVKFAQRFTDALRAYIAGDFVKAAQHVAPLADLELSAKAAVDNAVHSTPPPGAVVPATGNATGDGSGSDRDPLSTTASDIFDATLQGSASVELLRSLVQKAVADPPADMHQWDGIWHAESK